MIKELHHLVFVSECNGTQAPTAGHVFQCLGLVWAVSKTTVEVLRGTCCQGYVPSSVRGMGPCAVSVHVERLECSPGELPLNGGV